MKTWFPNFTYIYQWRTASLICILNYGVCQHFEIKFRWVFPKLWNSFKFHWIFYTEKSNLLILIGISLITYIYFCLLRSKVPLETCVHICIEGDFNDAILNRHHVFYLVCRMPCCYWSSKSSSLEKERTICITFRCWWSIYWIKS